MGHLNAGCGRDKLGCEIDEFVDQVKDRVVYIHASNNSGQMDEHAGLSEGTLDWRHVLDRLDLSKILKIIIEVRYMDAVEDCRNDLLGYLAGDIPFQTCYAGGYGR